MSDGTSITIRCMRHDDVKHFFAALKSAAESGSGYGYDEMSSWDVFVEYYVDGFRNVVAELTQTGDVMAYFNAGGPSLYARTADPVILDAGNSFLTPKYRGRHWYSELCNFSQVFMDTSDSEIRGYQGETAATNLPVHFAMMNINYTVNGILPRAIYFKDCGWVDLVLLFRRRPYCGEVLAKL